MVTSATLRDLAIDLVIRCSTDAKPPTGLLAALHDFDEKQLFGVLVYPQGPRGRGAILGAMLARVQHKSIAVVESWWWGEYGDVDVLGLLFSAFCERAPDWLSAVEVVIKEDVTLLLEHCKRLKMTAERVIPNKFGSRDGVVMRRYLLKGFTQ